MAKKRRSGLLLLSIILLLLGVIIYAYRDKFSVLFNTGFSSSKNFFKEKFAKKEKKENSDNENNLIKEKIELLEEKFNKKDNLEDDVEKIKEDFKKIKKEIDDDDKKNQTNNNERKPDNKNIKEENIIEKQETKRTEPKKEEIIKYNSRLSIIYFSKVLDDDTYKLIGVKRTVKYKNTPLTETLKSLLQGPNTDEKSASIITNIPTSTKILSVYIKNNIAYIDLSKDFQYNSYGRESTLAQLKQIVYTTTEFSNISSVQFLIEGKVQTYLGGEGVLINKPLSRNDFS